jgi:CPA2 family monovalent cation:H+ antiporter-2
MDQFAFHDVLALLAGAVVLVALFRYLHLPQLLAYLAAGILLGPFGAAVVPGTETLRYLAEFGLVFLMFTIGLDLSLPQLFAMKRLVFGLGGAQVSISVFAVALVAVLLGVALPGAIVIGGVLALSSTAIVMKLLIERLEQNSQHGRAAFAVLLFQDLVVVPFLIVIPAFGRGQEEAILPILAWSLIKGALVVLAFVFAGRWLLRPLFQAVAAARSREFFMLAVLLVVLTAAWLTGLAGLSLALGAFLAGLMIAETEYRHEVEVDILPFRDVLLGLFFVTVGTMLNPSVLLEFWPYVLLAVVALMVFKAALVTALGRAFGLTPGVAVRTGVVLAQGGEFGFALLVQAAAFDVLTGPAAQIVLAAVVVSMMFAPLLVHANGDIAKRLVPSYSEQRESNIDAIRAEADLTRPHVIVCGYGRSGQNLGWMLMKEGISFMALDLDPVRVRDARDAGDPVVYGDATRRDVLEAAGLRMAHALAVSYNDVPSAQRILEVVRLVRPDLPVIVRTTDDVDLERLLAAGATEVVPESLEGSLMIASHVLLLLGVPISHIVRRIGEVRRSRYRMLRGFFHGQDLKDLEEPQAYQERLHSVTLPPGAAVVGRRLSEIDLKNSGVAVTAVRRAGIRAPEPRPETLLQAGDVLVLYGTPEGLDLAEKTLLSG